MPCAVIITSLPIEYSAVRAHLSNIREVVSSYDTIYEMGQFVADERTWDIGIVELIIGNTAGGLEVDRAIHYFQPQFVVFVGISAGIKNVNLGDVVVATKIHEYEWVDMSQMELAQLQQSHYPTFRSLPKMLWKHRLEFGLMDYSLDQRVRAEIRKGDWLQRLNGFPAEKPTVSLGAIAIAGTLLDIEDPGCYYPLTDYTKYQDIIAEMRATNFLEAAVANQDATVLVVRGISDLSMSKKSKDFQEIASRHASAFAFEMLAKMNLKSNISEVQNSQVVAAIDLDEDEGINQPFDPAQIRIESKSMTIDLLLKRIQYRELNLSPDFQRVAGIWKPDVQSRLIESLLIRIPLPAFYIDATDDEAWVVIDGLQRLTTIKSFALDKKMKLAGLEFLQQFQGFSYDELPRDLQRRIEETQVTVYLIGQGTPPEVKFNIFKRINTGGLPLSPQEIRHALNQGEATKLIKSLSETTTFIEATGLYPERMIDQELVLRFLAFIITPPESYKSSDFDSFLTNTMIKINQMNAEKIAQLASQFDYAVKCASKLFGGDAFRKPKPLNKPRNPVNKSLFESWCVNLAKVDYNEFKILESREYFVRKGFELLMESQEFNEAISQGTGSTKKVRQRFSGIKFLIDHCLSDEYEDLTRLKSLFSQINNNSESLSIPSAI